MQFNVCLIQPEKYAHVYAFLELSQLIHFGLRELDLTSTISINRVFPSSINIIIGVHLMEPSAISRLPKNTIILNTEQLEGVNAPWLETILFYAKSFLIWDYSKQNIMKFNSLGFDRVKFLELGYQKELYRINKKVSQDIDILFYGSMNSRREKIISLLNSLNLNVHVAFSVYSHQRDDLISRSKIVLNLHYYDSQIFEVVRASYLINNAVAVVGEVNEGTSIEDRYLEMISPAKYENLATTCYQLTRDDSARRLLEMKALSTFQLTPQSAFLKNIL